MLRTIMLVLKHVCTAHNGCIIIIIIIISYHLYAGYLQIYMLYLKQNMLVLYIPLQLLCSFTYGTCKVTAHVQCFELIY
jgi:hypothetical protein